MDQLIFFAEMEYSQQKDAARKRNEANNEGWQMCDHNYFRDIVTMNIRDGTRKSHLLNENIFPPQVYGVLLISKLTNGYLLLPHLTQRFTGKSLDFDLGTFAVNLVEHSA